MARMGQAALTVFKVFLVWMVLSVPVAILGGKVLKARREQMEREAQRGRPANLAPRVIRDPKVCRALTGRQDRKASQGHRGRSRRS
jgi:hypothetical protein